MTLVADRFVRDADGRVIDLATGEPVTLVETTLRAAGDQRARREQCQALIAGGRLIDFALVGKSTWIEAYSEETRHGGAACAALDGVLAALDGVRGGDVRRLYVKAPRARGFAAFAGAVAREARMRGVVPVCPHAIERWPAVAALLRMRSVLLLGVFDGREAQPRSGRIARLMLALTRVVAAVVGVVVRVAERAAVAALRLPVSFVSSEGAFAWEATGAPLDAVASRQLARVAERAVLARTAAVAGEIGHAYPLNPRADRRGVMRRRPPPSSPWREGSLAMPVMSAADEEREESDMEGVDAEDDERVELPIVTTTMSGYGAVADALVRRGRWAAACRALRSTLAAHDRRDAHVESACVSLALARLFVALADMTNAARWLDHAGDRASRAGPARLIADVLHWSGIVALEQADLEKSERLLRTALAAAGPSADPRQVLSIELALARCLFWQGRVDEIVLPALDRLPVVGKLPAVDASAESTPSTAASGTGATVPAPPSPADVTILRVTYWRLVARLAMVRGDLSRAGEALARACRLARGEREDDVRSGNCRVGEELITAVGRERARLRQALQGVDADLRVACHLDAARLQLAIGDWAGCDVHLRECLALPRALARTRRIQVLQIARLRGDRRIESRRHVERLSAALRQAHVPSLMRIRARYLVESRSRRAAELTTFLARHGEVPLSGRVAAPAGAHARGTRGGSPMLDAFEAVLRICHETADDLTALTRVCTYLRDRLQAAHMAIHGAPLDRGRLAFAGSSRLASADLAARAIDSGLVIPPTYRPDALDAAAPIRYGQQTIGALVARWIVDATIDHVSAGALLSAAATALAPHVRAALDRHPPADAASASASASTSTGAAAAGGESSSSMATSSSSSSPARTLGLIGASGAIETLRQTIARVASAPFHVLIEGESGSGKELVARALHQNGPRRHRRFCAVNCAALTDDLLEAELFGHTRGAFTGAMTERAGLFEEADHGTLFLDEIGELSARGQAKLLRVIQDGETRRIGENIPRRVDARIVAATNRSLRDEAAAGQFRPDLLYRLDVIRIVVPPLRVRPEDVPILARAFWTDATARTGSRATLDPDTLAALARYHWPGNVRELQNAIMALAVHAPSRGRVPPALLPPAIRARSAGAKAAAHAMTLDAARREFESQFVRDALTRTGGHTTRAARELGLTREGLRRLMMRLGLHSAVLRAESAAVGAAARSAAAIDAEQEPPGG